MINLETKFAIWKFWMNFLWWHHCTQLRKIRQAKEKDKSDNMTFDFGKRNQVLEVQCIKDSDYYWLLCIFASRVSILLACYVTDTCVLFQVVFFSNPPIANSKRDHSRGSHHFFAQPTTGTGGRLFQSLYNKWGNKAPTSPESIELRIKSPPFQKDLTHWALRNSFAQMYFGYKFCSHYLGIISWHIISIKK